MQRQGQALSVEAGGCSITAEYNRKLRQRTAAIQLALLFYLLVCGIICIVCVHGVCLMYVEAIGGHQVSCFVTLCFTQLIQDFLLNMELDACQQSLVTLPVLSPAIHRLQGCADMPWVSCGYWEFEPRSSCLQIKYSYPLSDLISPSFLPF